MTVNRFPQYWVGRQVLDGPLLVVDLAKFMRPDLEKVEYYFVDRDTGDVKVAGVVDPLVPERQWVREPDENIRSEAERVLVSWRVTLAEERQARVADSKRRAAARHQYEFAVSEARKQLVELIAPHDAVEFTVELPQVPKEELNWLIEWCPIEVRAEFLALEESGLSTNALLQKLSKSAKSHITRICGARAAELGANQWFQERGWRVRDIAATQRAGDSDDWKTHDLLLAVGPEGQGGSTQFAVDVKNARQPEGKSGLAMRLMVRTAKVCRGMDVKLLGIISPYASLEQLIGVESGGPTGVRATILGWTDETRLQRLETLCTQSGLRFRRVDDSRTMLAPWAFESIGPVNGNTNAFATNSSRWEKHIDLAALDELQMAALNFRLNREPPANQASGSGFALLSRVASQCEQYGFTLSALYVTLVQHFLELVRTPDAEFSRTEWLRVLYILDIAASPNDPEARGEDDSARVRRIQNPLGIFDPTGSIAHLTFALETLWKRARTHLHNYESLELYGNGLVYGVHSGGRRHETVLAYCGGFSERGPCGRFPLVAGKHVRCTEGFLTCDKCGYCCERHKKRRSAAEDLAIIGKFLDGVP